MEEWMAVHTVVREIVYNILFDPDRQFNSETIAIERMKALYDYLDYNKEMPGTYYVLKAIIDSWASAFVLPNPPSASAQGPPVYLQRLLIDLLRNCIINNFYSADRVVNLLTDRYENMWITSNSPLPQREVLNYFLVLLSQQDLWETAGAVGAFMRAANHRNRYDSPVIGLLLRTIDLNKRDEEGRTLMMMLAERKSMHVKSFEKMIEAGADPFARTNDGRYIVDLDIGPLDVKEFFEKVFNKQGLYLVTGKSKPLLPTDALKIVGKHLLRPPKNPPHAPPNGWGFRSRRRRSHLRHLRYGGPKMVRSRRKVRRWEIPSAVLGIPSG